MKSKGLASLARGKTMTLVALMLFAAAGCGKDDPWNAALKSPAFVKTESLEKNAPQSILLIGENHAGVKTQQQLADLLQTLYQANEIDAILVEGSAGNIDAQQLRQSIATYRNTAEFWKGQLDLGHIAGYEYVALTQPGVTLFGIEDMDAQREYAVGAAGREITSTIHSILEKHSRGLALARQASASLSPGASQSAGVVVELANYQAKIDALAAFSNDSGSKYARAVELVNRSIFPYQNLYAKLKPILTLLSDSKGHPTEEAWGRAKRDSGYTDDEAIGADLKQLRQLEVQLTSNENEIDKREAAFETLEGELMDRFFIVANAVRSASGGTPFPALQTFMRDENERQRIESEKADPETPYLRDRDQHMVSNTMRYLSNPQSKRVVMIVGYAHLGDLTALFRQENVNVLVGKIAASSEDIEEWEGRAWEARRAPSERVFSSGRNKEKSRVLDPVFAQEIPLVVKNLTLAGKEAVPYGETRVFEWMPGTKQSKSIVLTSDTADLYANWGPSVVGSGRLPDGTVNHYIIVDRNARAQAARKATTKTVWFAPAYPTRTAGGEMTTHIDLPNGTVTVDTFKARVRSPGRKRPARIILIPEGDPKALHTALGGGAPPSGTNPGRRATEPPDNRAPNLFFTLNPERARQHMDALEKERPLNIGQLASFQLGLPGQQDSNLDNMPFTPGRGDNARAFLIAGANTPEFLKKLKDAAATEVFKNKQIALATCFDPKGTGEMRETLLAAGALMVWTPENRVRPEAAKKLQRYLEQVDKVSGAHPPKDLADYINRALDIWSKEAPTDPDLSSVRNSSQWTELLIPEPAVPGPKFKRSQQEDEGTANGI